MQAITLEVILKAVFGVTDPARDARLHERLPPLLGDTASPILQFRVLLSRRLGRGDPLAGLRELLVRDRRAAARGDRRAPRRSGSPPQREDILSLLVAARFEDGAEMSDREVRDQLITLLLAGHETTATALAWTFDLLLRNPATLARLTAEVDAGEAGQLPARGDLGVAAPAPGRPARGTAARLRAERRRAEPAGRDRRDAGDLADAHAAGPLPRAVRVPSRALPRGLADDLRLDPVRRRHQALSRRGLRRNGDAGRARDDPAPPRAEPREREGRAPDAPQRDVLSAPRHARAQPPARGAPRRPPEPEPALVA